MTSAVDNARDLIAAGKMTAAVWDHLGEDVRRQARSDNGLTAQLVGLEGWRVEVLDVHGETRRFIVGRSSGWIPCHIELARRNVRGGMGASHEYASVRKLYRVR